MNTSIGRILIILTLALWSFAPNAEAESSNNQNKKPAATTGKSSKSASPLMDKIKQVGNDASKGIHRASEGVRKTGDKVGKKSNEPVKEK